MSTVFLTKCHKTFSVNLHYHSCKFSVINETITNTILPPACRSPFYSWQCRLDISLRKMNASAIDLCDFMSWRAVVSLVRLVEKCGYYLVFIMTKNINFSKMDANMLRVTYIRITLSLTQWVFFKWSMTQTNLNALKKYSIW